MEVFNHCIWLSPDLFKRLRLTTAQETKKIENRKRDIHSKCSSKIGSDKFQPRMLETLSIGPGPQASLRVGAAVAVGAQRPWWDQSGRSDGIVRSCKSEDAPNGCWEYTRISNLRAGSSNLRSHCQVRSVLFWRISRGFLKLLLLERTMLPC